MEHRKRIVIKEDNRMQKEYITEINNLLPLADDELLDFVLQLLQRSIEKSVTPFASHQQSA